MDRSQKIEALAVGLFSLGMVSFSGAVTEARHTKAAIIEARKRGKMGALKGLYNDDLPEVLSDADMSVHAILARAKIQELFING